MSAGAHAMIEMMAKHRWLRRTLGLGIVVAGAYAIWRAVEANRVPGRPAWEPQPFPFPPRPTPSASPSAASEDPATPVVDESSDASQRAGTSSGADHVVPVDGACPATHPVKAKEASRIFHVPGQSSYERTVPDRCYADPAAAEADGFRAAKR